jgi:RecB family exonuclease
MKLKIFTTSRQIREWLKDKDNQFLDKHYTLGEFLKKIVVVDGKKFIDEDLRKKYLFNAVKNIDLSALGISKEFVDFFYDSEFILSFFNELFLERVEIDNVILNDVYLDYEKHLTILKEILKNYEKLLEKDGYIDRFLIKDFRINEGLLDGIKEIELRLDGYISRFDIEVLEKIKTPIKIYFETDKFNRFLIEKSLKIKVNEDRKYIYDFTNKKIIFEDKKKNSSDIEVNFFNERINQVSFVFAKIAEFVKSGIEPQNIAVILPDESFSEFLKLFDEYNNLNFAMGESFSKSELVIKLKAIYDYLSTDESAIRKCEDVIEEFENKDLIEFIRSIANNKELKVIDEELFKLEIFADMFKDKREFLYFVLERFKNLSFDDVYSGKVTVMGVLEGRGMKFEGVVIVDFNEDIVPNVNDSDLFLNTFIRKHSNLPTRKDRENLQKHYYYQLINNAKKVAISYVKNEEKTPSRFLYELGIGLGESADEKYKEVVFKYSPQKQLTQYNETFEIKYPLFPTTLKTLIECPKKYYFSKILGIVNEESEEEFFGNIFHKSIDEVIKEGFSSYEEYYDKLINKISSKISDKKLLFDVMVKWDDKIKEFCKRDFKNLEDVLTSKTEKTIKFFYKKAELAARVDRIDIKKDEVVLIDYKTSKSAKVNEDYPYDFQTTFYYLWAKENYPDKNIKTVIWDIYSTKKIEGIIKEDILKKVLNNLPNKVKEAEDILNEEKIIKKASEICKYCEYKVACGRDE